MDIALCLRIRHRIGIAPLGEYRQRLGFLTLGCDHARQTKLNELPDIRAGVASGECPSQGRLRGSQITGFNGHAGFQHGAESRIGGPSVAFF